MTQSTSTKQGSRVVLAIVIGLAVVIVAVAAYTYGHHTKLAPANATPTPSTSTSPSPVVNGGGNGAVTECNTANLAGSLDATGGGTAGTAYRQLILTNHGSQSCTLYGFPGVSLVDASGAQLGSPAARNGVAGATLILAPGQAAASAVGFPDAGNFDPGVCTTASTSLKVYPPDQTTALTIALATPSCPGFSVQTLVAR